MNIALSSWDNIKKEDFINYLKTFENKNRRRDSNIVIKTNKKILEITMKDIRLIVKEIKKGNVLSYLSHNWLDYYELTIIYSLLLESIDDFEIFKKYLIILSKETDTWATTDSLPAKLLRKKHGDKLFQFALELHQMKLPFQKRFGTLIMFAFIDNEHIDLIFKTLNQFKDENEYYVNMGNAWLLCEIFIKQREKMINYLTNHNLNKFTINKTIQKCRESFRVSREDKKMLIDFKVI